MSIKLTKKYLEKLILEAIQDYDMSQEPEAQRILNMLSVQQASVLKQIAELMGISPQEFSELLKDPSKLNDILELISTEAVYSASRKLAESHSKEDKEKIKDIIKQLNRNAPLCLSHKGE